MSQMLYFKFRVLSLTLPSLTKRQPVEGALGWVAMSHAMYLRSLLESSYFRSTFNPDFLGNFSIAPSPKKMLFVCTRRGNSHHLARTCKPGSQTDIPLCFSGNYRKSSRPISSLCEKSEVPDVQRRRRRRRRSRDLRTTTIMLHGGKVQVLNELFIYAWLFKGPKSRD